jgi:L-alanine-DL-glutamate epimerase-like enolase superfamily enzyme
MMGQARQGATVEGLEVYAFTVPTEVPEADGTLEWKSTTLVMVSVRAGDTSGIGFSYTDAAAAHIVQGLLARQIVGSDAIAIPAAWQAMVRAIRNLGRPGICSTAIAAVDMALWDLKARLLGVSLAQLFGTVRAGVPVYGSGGFTSYEDEQLAARLRGWLSKGVTKVKMKVGEHPAADLRRLEIAREAIGPEAELFVDANGAYDRKQALGMATAMRELGVTWFEEPVSSDDLDGLRLLRDRAPADMDIAAGEYGYDISYFRRMLDAGAVDVLQLDATRCAGYTEFLRAAALCDAHHLPISAHTAPNLHAHVCCAVPACRHVELFFDHLRIEEMLFEGVLQPRDGLLCPDLSRPGHGLQLRTAAAVAYQAYGPPLGDRA